MGVNSGQSSAILMWSSLSIGSTRVVDLQVLKQTSKLFPMNLGEGKYQMRDVSLVNQSGWPDVPCLVTVQ